MENYATECDARRDLLQTSFYIPELILANSQFASAIQVEEGAIKGEWKVRGTLARSMRLIEGSIASGSTNEKIILPYIRPHYNATVAFDSIAFKLQKSLLLLRLLHWRGWHL